MKTKTNDLREAYANAAIDAMSDKAVRQYAFDALYDSLRDLTDPDLENVVADQFPELLEDNHDTTTS